MTTDDSEARPVQRARLARVESQQQDNPASVDIRHGDALDELRAMPDASVDAIVTDPPYELGFMGKKWDGSGIAYSVELWREALRVLKPGGHLVAFGGTRTYHRMACAVEDAGFEIRDSLTWLYGSGFPKSLDVGKAIDKARDDRPDILHVTAFVRAARDRAGLRNVDVDAALGVSAMCDHWCRAAPLQATVPTWDQWLKLRELLNFGDEMDAEVWRLNGRKGTPGEAWEQREVIGNDGRKAKSSWLGTQDGVTSTWGIGEWDVTAPATDAARQWQGWGTALKPAQEPIVLARRPLSGTVAANVLAHGTGALNIDGTRVAQASTKTGGGWAAHKVESTEGWDRPYVNGATGTQPSGQGRWPANVLLTHGPDCADMCTPGCPVAELDAQGGSAGRTGAQVSHARISIGDGVILNGGGAVTTTGHGDTGGASRFFPVFRYQAKAPARERPKVDGVAHPTVKPLELMRWLVRLVTPPGGTVLDPFAGSGTTLQAARDEGFASIGIEREASYLPLITARLGIEIAEPAPAVPVAEVDPIPVAVITAEDIEHDRALAELQGVAYVPWPSEPVPVDPILKAIGEAADRTALVALWRAHKADWTPGHDEAVRDRLTAIADGEAVA